APLRGLERRGQYMIRAARHGDGAVALGLVHRLLGNGVEAGGQKKRQGGKASDQALSGTELRGHRGVSFGVSGSDGYKHRARTPEIGTGGILAQIQRVVRRQPHPRETPACSFRRQRRRGLPATGSGLAVESALELIEVIVVVPGQE